MIEAKSKNIVIPKGFYFEKNIKVDQNETSSNEKLDLQSGKENSLNKDLNDKCSIDALDEKCSMEDEINSRNSQKDDGYSDDEEWYSSEETLDDDEYYNTIEHSDDLIENEEKEEYEEDDEKISNNDDDDEGWITPKNIASMKKGISNQSNVNTEPLKVACLTTDFAMQVFYSLFKSFLLFLTS